MAKHRIYTTCFASVYPHYVAKAEKKGRTKAEVDEIISWLTGYRRKDLETQLKKQTDFETFFAQASKINPARALIKGAFAGYGSRGMIVGKAMWEPVSCVDEWARDIFLAAADRCLLTSVMNCRANSSNNAKFHQLRLEAAQHHILGGATLRSGNALALTCRASCTSDLGPGSR
jgi:hypothetical protein